MSSFCQGPRQAGGRVRGRSLGPEVQRLECRSLLSSAPVIDVMVLYTPMALGEAGSIDAINSRILRSIGDTNQALANSQVNASLRLVYEGLVNYAESGVINTDLLNLQTGMGPLAGVAALRNAVGADLVSLWVGKGDEGGRAFQPGDPNTPQPDFGYSVVQEQYADDNFVFAHEIGHNLGAGHDRSDPSSRVIPYAYGKTFTLGGYTVGDIMSDVDRIEYYSNPNVSFQGVPTGNPDNSAQPADNARVMNQFAPVVAGYRPTIVPDYTIPFAALDGVAVNAAQQTLTVRVQYIDDTAVAVSGLGTGDVLVTGPGGFSQVATFMGVDFAGDGPQRVASYQLSISGSSLDPNAYSFALQPGRLRDVYGHMNPGAPIGAPTPMWASRAGPRLTTALDAGPLDGMAWRFNNSIGPDDPTAFYRFMLAAPAQFAATLSGLSGSLDELVVQDRNGDGQIQPGEVLSYPHRLGTSPESISMSLSAGTYFVWVAPATGGASSPYNLTISASPLPAPSGGSIGGTIFNDANASGRRDPVDGGLAGWQVYADLNNNGRLDPGEPVTSSDLLGRYSLPGLAPGNYIVRAVPQPGWRQTTPANNFGQHVSLEAGQIVTAADFGQTTQARISGFVFNDVNGDRLWNAGETGLSGWRVFLDLNNDGMPQGWEPSTPTDHWGNWSFDNLAPGTYVVRTVRPSGWNTTTPPGGALVVTVLSGQLLAGNLFGEQQI